MPSAHIVRDIQLERTPRLMQVESMFDVPASEKSQSEWNVTLPLEERPWNIGLIVGPSGAGKTSVARQLFSDSVISAFPWSDSHSILDDFPKDLGIKDIVGLLTAVGFSSPPAWLRPFGCLSTGEQFRVTMARALAETQGLVAVDEFTSVVNRQVAQVTSHALQKAIRRQNRQFIAISCHYDLVDWLQPDWVYQPHADSFAWRCLQRHPEVELRIYPIDRSAWTVFRQHHYLSSALSVSAQCFGAFVGDECVAFTSYLHMPHPRTRNIKLGHRLVVLPDWQGLGIGGRLDDWLGQYLYDRGYRYHNVVAHPAMIGYYLKSPRWRCCGRQNRLHCTSTQKAFYRRHTKARTLQLWSFEYVPPKAVEEAA